MKRETIGECSGTQKIMAIKMAEGNGAEVLRLFPLRAGRMNRDPFVLFDHFFLPQGKGFPTHPHRGFEAITYIFRGGMQHQDNLGNASTVFAGGAQRFTAGRGIEHSEMPQGETRGIQLWINLPLRLKGIDPAYQAVQAKEIPSQQIHGAEVRTIVGEGSPIHLHTTIEYSAIKQRKGGNYPIAVQPGYQGLLYVSDGKIDIDNQSLQQGEALLLNAGFESVMHSANGAEVMLCIGRPHHEPIHQYGPYVD